MKATKQIIATGIVAGIVGLVVGWGLGGSDTPSGRVPAAVTEQDETWTCSMHPQIRQPKPGQCPIVCYGSNPSARARCSCRAGRNVDLLDAPADSPARSGSVSTVCYGSNSGGRARGW